MNISIYEQIHWKMFILDHKVSKEFNLLYLFFFIIMQIVIPKVWELMCNIYAN